MKKLLLLFVASVASVSAFADEGMWLLPYLQKMNIRTMKARGCKLSAEDIYSVDKSSLKDAIVIFGNGCTGEIVSPNGLLFTNHHCGFSSIQELSSVEHDYLKNGFWAMSPEESCLLPVFPCGSSAKSWTSRPKSSATCLPLPGRRSSSRLRPPIARR